jgi:hypothetical protein
MSFVWNVFQFSDEEMRQSGSWYSMEVLGKKAVALVYTYLF